MCHSIPILDQAKTDFQEYYGEQCSYGFYTGIAKSSIPTTFLFATFQSLSSHLEDFEKDEFSYIIVDEAHHSPADTYQPVVEYFQPKFLLGMTATPDRLDQRNIEEVFGSPIFELPMAKALVDGWIATIEYNLILDEVEEIGFYLDGDQKITKEELNRKVFMPKRDEEIIRLIKQYANEWCENPQIIIYCKTIVHAQKITELYDGAEAITSELEAKKNREIIARFKSGELRTIVSVEMLNEGVDIPSVDVIVFLRNTTAPRIFWQQLNRGTRKTVTKTRVRVLDFVANIEHMEMAFETQAEIEDTLKNRQPEGKNKGKALLASDLFFIDIPTPQFKERVYDIRRLLDRIASGRVWTVEEIIASLQKHAQNGFLPTYDYISQHTNEMPSPATIYSKLGRTGDIAKMTGLKPNRNNLSDYELLFSYYQKSKEVGHWLSSVEINRDKTLRSFNVYNARFGSKQNIQMRAIFEFGDIEFGELRDDQIPLGCIYSVLDIKVAIRHLTRQIQKRPGKTSIEHSSYCPDYKVCKTRLNVKTIEELWKVCGVDDVLSELGVAIYELEPIKQEEIEAMQNFVKQERRKLKYKDYKVIGVSSYRLQTRIGGIVDVNNFIEADRILAELD